MQNYQKQIRSEYSKYRGAGGASRARRAANNPYEAMQLNALKGYTPTTANVKIKETLIS